MRKSWIKALLALVISALALCSAWAADPPKGTFVIKPIGAPLGTGKMVFDATLVLGGLKVTRKVEIPSGDIKALVMPVRIKADPANGILEEPIKDFAQRVLNAQGEASNAKARVMADAVNAAFKDDFAKLPKAAADAAKAGAGFTIVKNRTIRVGNQNVPGLDAPFGELVIPNVSKEKDKFGAEILAVKIVEGKILGEGGNGGGFRKDPDPNPKSSLGVKVGMGPANSGITNLATGLDPFDSPSLVEFGIEGRFVASYMPAAGSTDEVILSALADMLDQHGIDATYDSLSRELFLDAPLPDEQFLVWGNTDTGLEFFTSFAGLDEAAVAEPSTLVLALLALLLLIRGNGGGRGWQLTGSGFQLKPG